MSEKIFKGLKQVKFDSFSGLTDEQKAGYLWFVRTVVPEVEGENNVANDEYDIYFGSRHYGHFCEGELSEIKAKIATLEGKHDEEVADILETLSEITDTISGQTSAIQTINQNLDSKADKTTLASYISKVEYTDTKIIFKNADDTKIGEVDATPFVKDGILDDVEVVTITEVPEENPHGLVAGEKYIKFVWNTDGESKEDYILTSEIGATYEGSESIEISSNNKISVKSVNSSLVNMQEIPVGGTPLADILTAKGINTINAGNLQSVIESLFSKEDWPTNTPVRNIPASASASQNQPTVSFSKTLAKVGETITVSATAATASGSATVSYSNFQYGYSAANDNTKDGTTPPSVTKNIVHSNGNYNLSATVTKGFNSGTISTDNITKTTTSATLANSSLVVEKGTNTVKVETSTPTFSITIPASEMPAYYACSTLKKTSVDHMVSAATEDKVYSGLTASNSKSASVTGVYPIYTNATWAVEPTKDNAADGKSNANTAYDKTGTTGTSDVAKLTQLTNDTATFYAFIAFGNGGFTFKLPTGWVITKAQTKSDTKGGTFDGNQGIPTPTSENISVAGTVKHDYNVYNFNIAASNVIRLEIKVG